MLKIAQDEILRKWSGGTAHLRTLRGSISYKKCTLLAAMLLFHSYFITHSISDAPESFLSSQSHEPFESESS